MTRLQAEFERLHFVAPAADGHTGALLLELLRPAGWEPVARVWQGVQAELDLPAPAIAVDGREAYQLWFALAEPVPHEEGQRFLDGVRARWLADVAPERMRLQASGAAAQGDQPLPPTQVAPERWSAFVAPDLAPLFADERCLDLAPSADAQAELLSRVQPIRRADWQRALERLRSAPAAEAAAREASSAAGAAAAAATTSSTPGAAPTQDARAFLLQVMNDPAVAMHLRIEAAKALLPWSADLGAQPR
jgi:hypothetical protein